jgi:hypothetical protein
MSGTEIELNGAVIRQSRNLRGMVDYARVSPVVEVLAVKDPRNSYRGLLTVTYANGATSSASFACYHVMVDWVRNRRTWRDASFSIEENMGYLTKPGIIAGA